MTRRRKLPAPLLNPAFVWHGSQTHDAGSEAFRQRQLERIARMQAKPEPTATVAPIRRKA